MPDAIGTDPALVLVNDDDLTYAIVRLPADTVPLLRSHLSTLESSLSRAIVASALWNATRGALLPAVDYLDLVGVQVRHESDLGLLRSWVGNAQVALERYLPAPDRSAARSELLAAIKERMVGAEPGSELQLLLARSYATGAATVPESAPRIRELLSDSAGLPELAVDPDLRWQWWQALASVDDATATDLTNDQLDAIVTGFSTPSAAAEHDDFSGPYFEMLLAIWRDRSQTMASLLAESLFPSGDVPPGGAVLDHHRDAPAALRRIVIEHSDHLRRALQAQAEIADGG